jgi:hypothetical protein
MSQSLCSKKVFTILFACAVTVLFYGCQKAQTTAGTSAKDIKVDIKPREEPKQGILITLSVYSGRPNPQWWVTQGPIYEKLVNMSEGLKTSSRAKASSEYDQWNRLGYASFWITPKNVKGMPSMIHIWRNMARVFQDQKGTSLYSDQADELYDLLVDLAEQKGQKDFFVNYHKSKQ